MIQDVRLPEISESVESGDIISVLVSVGDVVEMDQSLIELETDKATIELPSPFAGKITDIFVKEGETVKVGETVLKIEVAEEQIAAAEEISPVAAQKDKSVGTGVSIRQGHQASAKAADLQPPQTPLTLPASSRIAPASPSVKRLAREIGVDIHKVTGTGPGGRISAEDVKSFSQQVISHAKQETERHLPYRTLPDFSHWGEVDRVPMSKIRKITADGLSYSWVTIPHVTQVDKADITNLEEFRLKYGKIVQSAGGKLTVTSILVKIISLALKKFPQFNASVDMANEELVFKKYYHIGVAVDTDRGLLVPVVRDADKKSLTEISIELNDLAEKTRERKITPIEMEGGTFTLSNLGGIGGTAFTPIVYPPQVAILGVARSGIEPKYIDGDWKPRLMLPLTLSYDHRIIDGADGARFLQWIAKALEQPLSMLI